MGDAQIAPHQHDDVALVQLQLREHREVAAGEHREHAQHRDADTQRLRHHWDAEARFRRDRNAKDRAKYRVKQAPVWEIQARAEEEHLSEQHRRLALYIRRQRAALGRHLTDAELAALPDDPGEDQDDGRTR